jgi:hypothetical protein
LAVPAPARGGWTNPALLYSWRLKKRVSLGIEWLLSRRAAVLTVLCALVGVLPRLDVALRQYIEYDGWWHVFIAQQDVWSNFVWEVRANAHPPLFFLLLKAAMLLGKSRLTYRLVSLVAGVATAYVLGRIAGRWSRHWAVPGVTALAFSLSWSAIVVSCEVRSYALCVLFLAIAGYSFFELSHPRLRSVARHSLIFSVASALALLSHYSAALFLVAAAAVLAGRFALVPAFRHRAMVVLKRVPFRALLPAAVPLGTATVLFITHAHSHVTAMNHLPEYYLVSSSAGGPLSFLLRNTVLLVSLFLPFKLQATGLWTQAVVAAVFLLLVVGVIVPPRLRGSRAPYRVAGALVLALVVVAMVAGVAGVYPYGGALRHQFYLFPFVLVFLAAGLDVLLDRLGNLRARAGILLVVVAGLASAFATGSRSFWWVHDELATKEVVNLRQAFPEFSAVYVDQYGLVFLFSAYHDWTWRFAGVCPTDWSIQQYTLSKEDKTLTVFRDQARWEIDLKVEKAGKDLSGCLASVVPRPVVVFGLRQFPGTNEEGWLLSSGALARADASLSKAGVQVRTAVVTPTAAFVELILGPAKATAR